MWVGASNPMCPADVVVPSPKLILKGVFGTPLFSLRYKVVFGYLGRVFQTHP